MKKIVIIFIVIITLGYASCERDDICAESTPRTPLLVISFFDVDNPSEPKAPSNLAIRAQGQADQENPFLITSSNNISIPLRTGIDVTETVYTLTLNSLEGAQETPNTDILTVEYIQEEEFVSSACGFRVIYNDVTQQTSPQDDGAWIQDVELQTFTIIDETEAHLHIFH